MPYTNSKPYIAAILVENSQTCVENLHTDWKL